MTAPWFQTGHGVLLILLATCHRSIQLVSLRDRKYLFITINGVSIIDFHILNLFDLEEESKEKR